MCGKCHFLWGLEGTNVTMMLRHCTEPVPKSSSEGLRGLSFIAILRSRDPAIFTKLWPSLHVFSIPANNRSPVRLSCKPKIRLSFLSFREKVIPFH